jgi:hypothetical protein
MPSATNTILAYLGRKVSVVIYNNNLLSMAFTTSYKKCALIFFSGHRPSLPGAIGHRISAGTLLLLRLQLLVLRRMSVVTAVPRHLVAITCIIFSGRPSSPGGSMGKSSDGRLLLLRLLLLLPSPSRVFVMMTIQRRLVAIIMTLPVPPMPMCCPSSRSRSAGLQHRRKQGHANSDKASE